MLKRSVLQRLALALLASGAAGTDALAERRAARRLHATQSLDRLLRKWETAKKLVPRAIIDATAGSDIGIVSFGSCDGAIHEAIDVLKTHGVRVNYMRVRAFPFAEDVERFLTAHQTLFVVEQNRDAQFRSLLALETQVEKSKLLPLLYYSGLPISSSFIVEGVLAQVRPQPKQQEALGAAG